MDIIIRNGIIQKEEAKKLLPIFPNQKYDVTNMNISGVGILKNASLNLNQGEMIGDWEISLESNDPTSDFSYTYNWVTYFQDNS